MTDTCASCAYFASEDANGGTCRKNPPTAVAIPTQNPITGQTQVGSVGIFPACQSDFWCGEHKPNLVRV